MTTLVTGGAGFVAATLIGQLLARGDRVLALDNFSRGHLANLGPSIGHPALAVAQVDLADLAAYRQAIAAHAATPVAEVWHLAANSDIPAGIADPSVDLRDTFMTTFNTLQVMQEQGARHRPTRPD